MQIRVLGSGPNEPVIGSGKTGRLQSSILVDKELLVDATPSIRKQLKENEVIKAVLITHAHMDCITGLRYIKHYTKGRVPVYSLKHTLEWIPKRIGKNVLKHIEPKEVKPYKAFKLLNKTITPIPVEHSVLQLQFDPTLAWRINNLMYCEDVDYKFFFSDRAKKLKEYIKSADMTILDGAMCKGQIRGHLNLYQAANYLNERGYKNIQFIQVGRTCPSHEELRKQVKAINKTYDVTSDGQVFESLQSIELYQDSEAIYLVEPHAKMIWQGNKKLIVKAKKFEGKIGKLLYLVGGNNCYGAIKIKKIKPISLQLFNKLRPLHRITEEERAKWWPDKKVLFAYEFDVVKRFEQPKLVKVPVGAQTFISNLEFLTELQLRAQELIKDVSQYDPSKVALKPLRDDFRIALAWYCSKKAGKKVKLSFEEIENLLQLIVEELIRRGNTVFHPEKMKPCAREAFRKIESRVKKGKLSESLLGKPRVPKFAEHFNDAVLIKDFVSLIGSSVESNKYHDIDILIRSDSLSDYLKRALETRITKMLPAQFSDKLHFVYGDPEGPHDSFVPLYDLALVRLQPEVVKMSASVAPMKPFLPMKPRKRFYEVSELIDYLFRG